jgi:ABC-type transporter Mla subunit MlaD
VSVSDTTDSSQQQHETSAPYNPLEQLISLLTLIDPVEFASKAIDASRRTSESLITILENLASTVDNLNKTTTRVNSLLDEVEEPLRRVMPQLGTAMNAVAALGETAQQLGELSKRLGPLTTLAENAGGLFGLRPNKPSSPPSTGDKGPTSS